MGDSRILKLDIPNKESKINELCENFLLGSDIKFIEILLSEVHQWATACASDFVAEQNRILTTAGDKCIKDTDTLIAFTDYQNGYVGQMHRWMKENTLQIKADYVSSETGNPLSLSEREAIRRPLIAITGGAVLAGFLTLCQAKYLWLLEIIPAFAAVSGYKRGTQVDAPKIKSIHLERDKRHYRSLCQDLTDYWFSQVEKKSQEILSTYNIC